MVYMNFSVIEHFAQGTARFASITGNKATTQNLEKTLEDQLKEVENQTSQQTKLKRCRLKGQTFVHNKWVLLFVVCLCVTDCILVIGELILDMHAIKETVAEKNGHTAVCECNMTSPIMSHVKSHQTDSTQLLGSVPSKQRHTSSSNIYVDISRKNSNATSGEVANKHKRLAPVNTVSHHRHDIDHERASHHPKRTKRSGGEHSSHDAPSKTVDHGQQGTASHGGHATGDHGEMDSGSLHTAEVDHADQHEHPLTEKIGHGLHFTSITILGVLTLMTFVKIFFIGPKFIRHKMEMFDAFVVITSFVVDLYFLDGITSKSPEESAYLLSFLLPWRFIRIVNSLVVAVLDHEHYKLMVIYKSKKRLVSEVDEIRNDMQILREQLSEVKKLCYNANVEEWRINHCISQVVAKFGRKKQALNSLVSFSIGAVVAEQKPQKPNTTDSEEKDKNQKECNGGVNQCPEIIVTEDADAALSQDSGVVQDSSDKQSSGEGDNSNHSLREAFQYLPRFTLETDLDATAENELEDSNLLSRRKHLPGDNEDGYLSPSHGGTNDPLLRSYDSSEFLEASRHSRNMETWKLDFLK